MDKVYDIIVLGAGPAGLTAASYAGRARTVSYTHLARIPHFYRAFYVYQYATGISAAVAIANRIRKLGQPAIEDYKNFLRSGSSDHPIELLKMAGVDMASPQPMLDIIEDFNQTLKQLEELL